MERRQTESRTERREDRFKSRGTTCRDGEGPDHSQSGSPLSCAAPEHEEEKPTDHISATGERRMKPECSDKKATAPKQPKTQQTAAPAVAVEGNVAASVPGNADTAAADPACIIPGYTGPTRTISVPSALREDVLSMALKATQYAESVPVGSTIVSKPPGETVGSGAIPEVETDMPIGPKGLKHI